MDPETQGEDFRLTRSQVLDVLEDFLAHRSYAKEFVRGQRRFVFDYVARPRRAHSRVGNPGEETFRVAERKPVLLRATRKDT
jgi:hypothetical protein